MTALPETNDVSDSGTNNDQNQEQHPSSSDEAAEPSSELPSSATPQSGKRDQTSIMGGSHSAKREKREWLSFRGTKHTRVGEEYQVAFLPPVGSGTAATDDKSKASDEKGNYLTLLHF